MFIEIKRIIKNSNQREDEIEIYKAVLPNTINLLSTVVGTSGIPNRTLTKEYLISIENRNNNLSLLIC